MSEPFDNEDIYDMTKHINTHLKKYKILYKGPKSKEDASKIDKHISMLDTKIQLIAKQIKDFSTMSQNASSSEPFPEKRSGPYNRHKNLSN